MTETITGEKHRPYEDLLAILLGASLVSFGLILYGQATLVTGSTAGIALLVSHVTGWRFGAIFFVINLPFYWLAFARLGWLFTLKTFVTVGLVSLLSWLMPRWIGIAELDPVFAAIMGGALSGMGLLVLFRHRSGLGGVTTLALYLQDRKIVRAGYFQLALDVTIMACAAFVLPWDRTLLSLLGAAVFNLMIAINHRPGRYVGMS
jgi:uncharacterized membrane-anchored protein YitT (DUF2179 family)